MTTYHVESFDIDTVTLIIMIIFFLFFMHIVNKLICKELMHLDEDSDDELPVAMAYDVPSSMQCPSCGETFNIQFEPESDDDY